jgi:hypothetical protein
MIFGILFPPVSKQQAQIYQNVFLYMEGLFQMTKISMSWMNRLKFELLLYDNEFCESPV